MTTPAPEPISSVAFRTATIKVRKQFTLAQKWYDLAEYQKAQEVLLEALKQAHELLNHATRAS